MASHAQRMAALEAANAIRSARARLKVLVRNDVDLAVTALLAVTGANATAAALFEAEVGAPASVLDSMRTLDYLKAIPGFGPVKAAKTLRTNGIAASRTLGRLTAREAAAVYTAIDRVARRRQEDTPR